MKCNKGFMKVIFKIQLKNFFKTRTRKIIKGVILLAICVLKLL